MDVIVSVGMGPGQLDFIIRLKESGYNVVSFGKGINSKEAMELSDFSAEIDTRDYYGAITWIDSLEVNVIGVGSFAGGAAVATVQRIANYYHTSTAIPEQLIVSGDKISQQRLLESYGLSSIHTWKAKELTKDILEEDGNDLYILKPSVGRGSEGIKYVNKEQLLCNIINESLNEEDIVQVVRAGIEYRCVIIAQDGKIRLLAPILRKSYKDTVFLGLLSYSDKHINRLVQYVEEFIAKSGIINSIFKADIIVSESSIDMIEMDISVGGGSYFKRFVSELYDRDLVDEYIKLITGKKVQFFEVKRPNLVMEYIYNTSLHPICYDLQKCKDRITQQFGYSIIQVNRLHPENKGGYSSNADFIFTVIYQPTNEDCCFQINEYANKHLFIQLEDK